MDTFIEQAGFGDILEKVRAEERLSLEDGQRLFASNNLLALGYLANIVRERKNGIRLILYITSILTTQIFVPISVSSVPLARKKGISRPMR